MVGEGADRKARNSAEAPDGGEEPCRTCRRAVLKSVAALGLAGSLPRIAHATPQQARPQPGDRFVFVAGDKAGTEIKPDDLAVGSAQVLAWPVDPQTRIVRNASRLNQVLLVRLEPERLDETTRERAADGIVAYSASCTHALCPVTGWKEEKQLFSCHCHGSEYDPRIGGKVVFGPAPRPLPALPLKIEDGALVAGASFIGRVGTAKT
jgi:Rieske Fe-S protein